MMLTENRIASLFRFDAVSIADLEGMTDAERDEMPFGVIGMSRGGVVEIYNAWERRNAGMKLERVIGRRFFADIGVCMNNYLVAKRFEEERTLDAVIDYTLTFRMKPTPVTLRMLADPSARRRYLLVRR